MSSLVSTSDFASYLQRDLDRYSAELALAGASGLVRIYCGWPISQVLGDVMTVDSHGGTALMLPTLRLTAVASVGLVDGSTVDAGAYTWGANGVLYRADGWPTGARAVTATVDHGYDPIPDEVRIVVCAVAARLYSNPEGLTSKTSGDGGKTFGTLSELEVRLIAGHRLG